MKSTIRHALFLDAFYQVLDNKIFRLLLFLALGVVAASFLIGFREDRVDILFGWQSISYDDFLGSFGMPGGAENVQEQVILAVQGIITGFLGGVLGMVFCISATAFFIPRMLEKGSADIVFSKPVSRFKLMLSRYMAGILFVVILALLLVGGVYLGLALTSGFHDTSFLWNALTLVYLYALLHSVSLFVGVLTRSTVATILITIVFFGGTGCVHQVWQVRSFSRDAKVAEQLRDLAPEERAGSEEDGANLPGFVKLLLTTFDVAHYVLPKTSDARFVSKKLRKAITGPALELVDEEGKLSIRDLPSGFRRVEQREVAVNLADRSAEWTVDGDQTRIEIRRETRLIDDPSRGPRRQNLSSMTRVISEEITARSSTPPERNATAIDRVSAMELTWSEDGARRHTVLIAYGDWLYRIELRTSPDPSDKQVERRFRRFLDRVSVARDSQAFVDPEVWYEDRFDWTAPLPFNVFFSVGSSIAFALLMLGLAWWRLSRIDF